jgi:hypothetical protein
MMIMMIKKKKKKKNDNNTSYNRVARSVYETRQDAQQISRI